MSVGLIDALELFSAMIIFSDSRPDDKCECKIVLTAVLFDLFDFNQIHTLSLLDFQFLLHSSFCGAAKLFSILI